MIPTARQRKASRREGVGERITRSSRPVDVDELIRFCNRSIEERREAREELSNRADRAHQDGAMIAFQEVRRWAYAELRGDGGS